MNKIQELKCSISKKCAYKDYEQVNICIDNIICDEQNVPDIEKVKALICQLEGQGNQANAYTVMGICYSFAIGAFSIINNVCSVEYALLSSIILLVVVVLVSVAIRLKYKGYKEAFILKTLNFKLEELSNKESISEK